MLKEFRITFQLPKKSNNNEDILIIEKNSQMLNWSLLGLVTLIK